MELVLELPSTPDGSPELPMVTSEMLCMHEITTALDESGQQKRELVCLRACLYGVVNVAPTPRCVHSATCPATGCRTRVKRCLCGQLRRTDDGCGIARGGDIADHGSDACCRDRREQRRCASDSWRKQPASTGESGADRRHLLRTRDVSWDTRKRSRAAASRQGSMGARFSDYGGRLWYVYDS